MGLSTSFDYFIDNIVDEIPRHSIKQILSQVDQVAYRLVRVPSLTSEDIENIKLVQRRYKKFLRELRRVALTGSASKMRAKVEQGLKSESVKAFAYLLTFRKYYIANILSEKISKAALLAMSKKLDPFRKQPGWLKLNSIENDTGKPRVALSFSQELRSLQLLVSHILVATGHRNEFEYCQRGRGSAALVKSLGAEIEQGYVHCLIGDIKNYYSSIKSVGLPSFPLDKRVMKWVVFANEYLPISGGTTTQKKLARLGLPLGAPSSNAVASDLIGRELRKLPELEYRRLSFVDDFVVCARNRSDIEKASKQLSVAFQSHPAGPFSFKVFHETKATPKSGVTLCGYHLRLGYGRLAGTCRIFPDLLSYEKMKRKIWRTLDGECDKGPDKMRKAVDEYTTAWLASFSAYEPSPFGRDYFEITVDQCIAEYGTSAMAKHKPLMHELKFGELAKHMLGKGGLQFPTVAKLMQKKNAQNSGQKPPF